MLIIKKSSLEINDFFSYFYENNDFNLYNEKIFSKKIVEIINFLELKLKYFLYEREVEFIINEKIENIILNYNPIKNIKFFDINSKEILISFIFKDNQIILNKNIFIFFIRFTLGYNFIEIVKLFPIISYLIETCWNNYQQSEKIYLLEEDNKIIEYLKSIFGKE